jgi:hypothetical protein
MPETETDASKVRPAEPGRQSVPRQSLGTRTEVAVYFFRHTASCGMPSFAIAG